MQKLGLNVVRVYEVTTLHFSLYVASEQTKLMMDIYRWILQKTMINA